MTDNDGNSRNRNQGWWLIMLTVLALGAVLADDLPYLRDFADRAWFHFTKLALTLGIATAIGAHYIRELPQHLRRKRLVGLVLLFGLMGAADMITFILRHP